MIRYAAVVLSIAGFVTSMPTALAQTTVLGQNTGISRGVGDAVRFDPRTGAPSAPSERNSDPLGNVLDDNPRDTGSKPVPATCDNPLQTDEIPARCRKWAEIALSPLAVSPGRVAAAA